MAPTATKYLHNQRRGFTLTELAIVMSVMGLILGAIWFASGTISDKQKIANADTDITAIVQNVRSLYSSNLNTGLTDKTDQTYYLCSSNIFPANMVPSSGCGSATTPATINDPWGGSITIAGDSISATNAGDGFRIQMTGLTQTGCTGILTNLSGNYSDLGLYYISGGTTAPIYTAGTTAATTVITPAAAGALCGAGSNTVLAVFRLKG